MRLQSAYAGDKADDIQKREGEVLEAWRTLLEACDGRRVRLLDTGDKFRFFSMVRDLMLWMEDVIRLIEAQEKPRYCEPDGKQFGLIRIIFLNSLALFQCMFFSLTDSPTKARKCENNLCSFL